MSEICDGAEYTCGYCENATVVYNTQEVYCLDIPAWRMTLFGPRLVSHSHTCKKCVIAAKYTGRTR